MESPFSGERSSWQLVGCPVVQASNVNGMKRLVAMRWRASCDMRWECRPPCRLMYATVAVLSVRTSTCLPHKRLLRRFKARCTASDSRQLMCQCSWEPVQTPILQARQMWPPSRWWRHPCEPRDAWRPIPGALLPGETKGLTTRWRFGGRPVWLGPGECRVATPTSGLGHGASVEAVSYEAAPALWLPLQLQYAPGAS